MEEQNKRKNRKGNAKKKRKGGNKDELRTAQMPIAALRNVKKPRTDSGSAQEQESEEARAAQRKNHQETEMSGIKRNSSTNGATAGGETEKDAEDACIEKVSKGLNPPKLREVPEKTDDHFCKHHGIQDTLDLKRFGVEKRHLQWELQEGRYLHGNKCSACSKPASSFNKGTPHKTMDGTYCAVTCKAGKDAIRIGPKGDGYQQLVCQHCLCVPCWQKQIKEQQSQSTKDAATTDSASRRRRTSRRTQ